MEGKLRTGGISHTVLAGVEIWRVHSKMDIFYSNLQRNPFAIDIYQPIYGQPAPEPLLSIAQTDRQRAAGLFLQDQIDLSAQWKLMAGLRFDRFNQVRINRLRGTRMAQKDTAVTPRVGLNYMITPDSSAYVSYGCSFRPNQIGRAHV